MSAIAHGLGNILMPGSSTMTNWNKNSAANVANPNNEEFKKAAKQYQNTIDNNTGLAGNNTAYKEGLKKGGQLTQLQSNGAASQALGSAVSAGQTRGRAADMAASQAANAYTNNYANNVQNQQNVANQQLANQLNAQGTLMSANLTNDQAQYQQNWNNYTQGSKMNAGAGFFDIFSDENAKDKVEVGKSENLKDNGYPNSMEGIKPRPKLRAARPIGVTTGNNRKAKNLNVKKPYGKKLTKAQNLSIKNPYFLQEDEETNVSDMNLKDSLQIGLSDEDPRMTRYKLCGEKLKQMNPNKWKELKWEAK